MGKGHIVLCHQHVSVKLRHHHEAQTSSHKTHTQSKYKQYRCKLLRIS